MTLHSKWKTFAFALISTLLIEPSLLSASPLAKECVPSTKQIGVFNSRPHGWDTPVESGMDLIWGLFGGLRARGFNYWIFGGPVPGSKGKVSQHFNPRSDLFQKFIGVYIVQSESISDLQPEWDAKGQMTLDQFTRSKTLVLLQTLGVLDQMAWLGFHEVPPAQLKAQYIPEAFRISEVHSGVFRIHFQMDSLADLGATSDNLNYRRPAFSMYQGDIEPFAPVRFEGDYLVWMDPASRGLFVGYHAYPLPFPLKTGEVMTVSSSEQDFLKSMRNMSIESRRYDSLPYGDRMVLTAEQKQALKDLHTRDCM